MSATPTPAPAPRTVRRPFLTRRVLRGLWWLALYGWDRIERMTPQEVAESGVPEEDALYAYRWIERMRSFRAEEKGARS